MPYLIGTDEAGYGPNLGPLVISASVWQVPDGVRGEDLYGRLKEVIACSAGVSPAEKRGPRSPSAVKGKGSRSGGIAVEGRRDARTTSEEKRGAYPANGDKRDACPAERVAMADSKSLYQSGKGLRLLEQGLWAAFALLDERPSAWTEVWKSLAPECCEQRRAGLCDADDNPAVPLDADVADVDRLAPRVREGVAAAGVRLLGLRSRVLFPAEFNVTVQQCGSKGTALSRWTLDLVARAIRPLPGGRISVLCDKHGGRDRYVPLLMECFPDAFIEVHGEGRERSTYRFSLPNEETGAGASPDAGFVRPCHSGSGPAGGSSSQRRVDISFQAKGEAHLPTALASMASKYLRELAMRAFNAYWCSRVPGLPPTAGYPNDAARFKAQIAAVQKDLGVQDDVLWRLK
jgi:hypothetical protein